MDNYIRVFRSLKKERQEDVAKAIGVTVGTINQIENGKNIPSFVVAVRLARHFNTTVEKLFIIDQLDMLSPIEDLIAIDKKTQ